MKKIIGLMLSIIMVITLVAIPAVPKADAAVVTKQNSYPIILTGGLGVWGRDEGAGVKYWGGLADIQENLKSNGYETYTSAVGPVSSYYDRGCELYAQIQGTRVDYGAAHAAQYGHERFGRDYTGRGFVPDWGTPGNHQKVSLVGHSMGGPTNRALVSLLYYGKQDEIAYAQAHPESGPVSPLFQGGNQLINSVMTISSCHDGTSLLNIVDGNIVQILLCGWVPIWNGGNSLYDWKLDQWGFERNPGESISAYNDRVLNSPLWDTNRDLANYDGTAAGAREFNAWAKADPNVYYFSWATETTTKSLLTGHQLPELCTNPAMSLWATQMGAYQDSDYDKSWRQNDGIVNTKSMNGPKLNSTDTIVNYTGVPQKGKWNYLGVRSSWDHSDIIGIGTVWNVTSWYRDQAKLLCSVPK